MEQDGQSGFRRRSKNRLRKGSLERLSVAALSSLIEQKDLSPVEVLSYFFARCDRLNPHVNAIVAMNRESAHAAARQAEKRALQGARLSPLDGIPITVKDNIFVRGFAATWGSRLYQGFKPDRDDIAVERLRSAGAIFLGKTNTPEFALSQYTDNLVFGATRNPWALELTPGGSSGGAVAALPDAALTIPTSYSGQWPVRIQGTARQMRFPPCQEP